MKFVLVSSQFACLLFLLLSGHHRQYRIFTTYMLFVITATLAFRAEEEWLQAWYVWLDTPVVLLRCASAIEVIHRQTQRYRDWWLLMAGVFLLAYTAGQIVWSFETGTALYQFLQLRRQLHIWTGAVCFVLQIFWVLYAWENRIEFWVSFLFSTLCWNHAAVALIGLIGWNGFHWWRTAWLSWGIDSFVYVGMGLIFRHALTSTESRATLLASPPFRGPANELQPPAGQSRR